MPVPAANLNPPFNIVRLSHVVAPDTPKGLMATRFQQLVGQAPDAVQETPLSRTQTGFGTNTGSAAATCLSSGLVR